MTRARASRWTVWMLRLRSRFASGWARVTSRDRPRCVGSSMRWRTTTRCGAGCLRARPTRWWTRTSFPRLRLRGTTREVSRSVCTCAIAGGSTARSVAMARVSRATTRSSRWLSRLRRAKPEPGRTRSVLRLGASAPTVVFPCAPCAAPARCWTAPTRGDARRVRRRASTHPTRLSRGGSEAAAEAETTRAARRLRRSSRAFRTSRFPGSRTGPSAPPV